MTILIIKLGALGDVVRTSYFLHGLRKKLGSAAHITWVTSERVIPLLKHHPDINLLLTFEEIAGKKVQWGHQEFDWIISLDDEAHACGLLKRLTWKKLTGAYLQETRVDYTDDASPWFDMGLISHLGKEKADTLKKLNQRTHDQIFGDILGIEVSEPRFYNSRESSKIADQLLGEKTGHFLGLNLSAGNRWLNKQLDPFQAELLVRNLIRAGFPILLLGGTEDEAYNGRLAYETGCRVLPSVPLGIFAAVIRQLRAIISADTLALHLAIAQRIPSISFFAPTSAAEINTFGMGQKITSTSSDYCNYQSNADNSTITASRLLEAVSKLFDEKHSSKKIER